MLKERRQIFIKDVKSSNGTFINGEHLSLEGRESDAYELKSDNILVSPCTVHYFTRGANDLQEFGVDIVSEDKKTVLHRKVVVRITCVFPNLNSNTALNSNLNAKGDDSPPVDSSLPSLEHPTPKTDPLPLQAPTAEPLSPVEASSEPATVPPNSQPTSLSGYYGGTPMYPETSINQNHSSSHDPEIMSANQLKDEGNKVFDAGDYNEAINLYVQAYSKW
jgi:hypothetical protein